MRFAVAFAAVALVACGGNGKEWVKQLPDENSPVPDPGWNAGQGERPPDALPDEDPDGGGPRPRSMLPPAPAPDDERSEATLRYEGGAAGLANDLFRNTYYDFPRETAGRRDATIFDAACSPIASVTKDFHDRLCVQGSGKLVSGATVSFAKRGCGCAAMCPRTGQQICFERLDPVRYPAGRGATGKAITPLRTIAVDPTVIPLGAVVFIPEFVGLPTDDGTTHDGCFIAEDRGLRVQGRQVDVFTGDPTVTARWNKLFPSNKGVHVNVNEARCLGLAGRAKQAEK